MFNKKIKILIVDDHQSYLERLKNCLNGFGYNNLVSASSGEEALSRIQKATSENAPIELVITDLHMPEMTGIQLLENIKKDEGTKHIPVIMVSTEGEKEAIIDALHYGVSDYVFKPFEDEALIQKMNSVHSQLHKSSQ